MFTPSRIFINVLVLISGSLYWLMSGHMIPAVLGYLFVMLYMLDERLYLLSDILAIITFLIMLGYLYHDFYYLDISYKDTHFGAGLIYMFVIYLKARQIFDNDDESI